MSQPQSFQRGEIFINIFGRFLETCPVPLGGSTDEIRGLVELERQEVVRMLGFHAIGLQDFFRKIPDIERHDEVSTSVDRGCQNVTVVRVGQRDGVDQCLVASHKAIQDMRVHQLASPLKLFRFQIRAVFENISYPLIVDGIGPFGVEKVRDRDMQ